jgi:tetratricopeptide (TPR) repeat protein
MFLFLPIVLGLNRMILQYRQRRFMEFFLLTFCVLLIVGFGSGTFIRNMAWKSHKSLWEDAMRKAPLSSRPPYNLATLYYLPRWRFATALSLYERSLASPNFPRKGAKVDSLINMASIYSEKGDYGKAIQLTRKALEWDFEHYLARKTLILNLLLAGHYQKAEKQADYLLQARYINEWSQFLKGLVLVHQKRYADALLYLNNSVTLKPDLTDALIAGGIAYSRTGNYGKAACLYERAIQVPIEINSEGIRKNSIAHFGLIDNALLAGQLEAAARHTDRFLAERSLPKIEEELARLSAGRALWPLPPKRVARYIGTVLEERGQQIRSNIP